MANQNTFTVTNSMMDPHEILHRNVSLLQNYHPASDELKNVFKKGMFKLPNKNGFFQVAHYLNSIIDGKKWNSAISWPVLDNKDEMKFRLAVRKFTAELNEGSLTQVLPVLEPSLLLSPGGLQVARYITKLSEYALRKLIEEALGLENALSCLKYQSDISFKARQRIEIASAHENMKTIRKIHLQKQYIDYSLQKKKDMQQKLIELRAQNDEIERVKIPAEIAEIVDDDIRCSLNADDDEILNYWTSDLETRKEKLRSDTNYLALLENPVDRCYQLAKRLLEKNKNEMILDGLQIAKFVPENDKQSSPDLSSFMNVSIALARRLTSELESRESKLEVLSHFKPVIQGLQTDWSQSTAELVVVDNDMLKLMSESLKTINELESFELPSEVDLAIIPRAVKNYTETPPIKLMKQGTCTRHLEISHPVQGTNILDWVRTNLFAKNQKLYCNRNTPKTNERVSLLPKKIPQPKTILEEEIGSDVKQPKGLILKKNLQSLTRKQNPIRSETAMRTQTSTRPRTPQSQTPIRNSSHSIGRLVQDLEVVSQKPSHEDEESIVLPHNLSVSTGSPCSAVGTPPRMWKAVGLAANSGDCSSVVSSIRSPTTWAQEQEENLFSSTLVRIDGSISGQTNDPNSNNLCQSSPSGVVHFPVDENRTSDRKPKIRPSLENIISRYKRLKSQMAKGDE